MSMEYRDISLKCNGSGYVVGDYIFVRKATLKNRISVRCQNYNKLCPAKGFIKSGKVYLQNETHNHNVPDVLALDVRSKVKSRVKDPQFLGIPVNRICEDVRNETILSAPLEQREDLMSRLQPSNSMARCMRVARNEDLSQLPRSREGTDLKANKEILKTANDESFLLADSGYGDPERILIFGSSDGLRHASLATEVHLDGTFWTVPFIFY